jgi:hypothetical protein
MFTSISKFATYLSSGKERFTLEGAKKSKEQKKTLDKFEIIRKKQLEHSLQY